MYFPTRERVRTSSHRPGSLIGEVVSRLERGAIASSVASALGTIRDVGSAWQRSDARPIAHAQLPKDAPDRALELDMGLPNATDAMTGFGIRRSNQRDHADLARFVPRFAFTRTTASEVELWVGQAATAKVRRIPDVAINAAYGAPIDWLPGSQELLCQTLPRDRGQLVAQWFG